MPIVIKFSRAVSLDAPTGKAAEYLRKIADEHTKGKAKGEVYADSSLCKDKEELEALQLEAEQMLAPSLAKSGTRGGKEFEVVDLTLVFDNAAELHKVVQRLVGQSLLKPRIEP